MLDLGTIQRSRDWSRNSPVGVGPPPSGCHHYSLVYRELFAFNVVLYKKNNTSHTHRMSADCYFMCHVTLIFLEMISGYLEEKNSVILL